MIASAVQPSEPHPRHAAHGASRRQKKKLIGWNCGGLGFGV